jgi:uncharacterized protein
MLGKLARWLRLMGFDTRYMQGEDAAIAHCARAEGRVLLTRDHTLAERKGLRTILLRAETLEAQLAEVIAVLGTPSPEVPARCMHCNVPLAAIPKKDAGERVPAYVLETHETFQECRKCGKIYWKGTHWQGIAERIDCVAGATDAGLDKPSG